VATRVITTTLAFAPGVACEFASVMPAQLQLRDGNDLPKWLQRFLEKKWTFRSASVDLPVPILQKALQGRLRCGRAGRGPEQTPVSRTLTKPTFAGRPSPHTQHISWSQIATCAVLHIAAPG
jgi:hypothetical protein